MDVIPRILAVDWSGALKGARKIWLAEVSGERLVCLRRGLDRSEITNYLIAESKKTPEMIVGLDFAFSCPGWYVRSKSCQTIHEFWKLAGEQGEWWMKALPFWSKCKPEGKPEAEYRRCEDALQRKPSSVFKLVGPAQVGRRSIRGMPHLLRLHQSGFSVWPFDPPRWPRAIEIYPRLFSPGIVKSDRESRRKFLAKFRDRCSGAEMMRCAEDSDDAFDALISAFAMSEHSEELSSLTQASDAQTRIEGAIWFPIANRTQG